MRTAESVLFTCCPSGARRPIRIDPQVALVHFDLGVVLYLGIDEDGREGGMSARLRVERRDPDQAVHALLRLQKPEGGLPGDLERGTLDSGLLPRLPVQNFDVVPMPLGPAAIHAHQHLGPLLRLGAPRSRMNREDRAPLVVLALEHGSELQLVHPVLRSSQLSVPLLLEPGVRLFLQELRHLEELHRLPVDLRPRPEPALQARGFSHDLASVLRTTPEVGLCHSCLELLDPALPVMQVKGTPSGPGPVGGAV